MNLEQSFVFCKKQTYVKIWTKTFWWWVGNTIFQFYANLKIMTDTNVTICTCSPIVVIEITETCSKPISTNISNGCMFNSKFMMRSTLFLKPIREIRNTIKKNKSSTVNTHTMNITRPNVFPFWGKCLSYLCLWNTYTERKKQIYFWLYLFLLLSYVSWITIGQMVFK